MNTNFHLKSIEGGMTHFTTDPMSEKEASKVFRNVDQICKRCSLFPPCAPYSQPVAENDNPVEVFVFVGGHTDCIGQRGCQLKVN